MIEFSICGNPSVNVLDMVKALMPHLVIKFGNSTKCKRCKQVDNYLVAA